MHIAACRPAAAARSLSYRLLYGKISQSKRFIDSDKTTLTSCILIKLFCLIISDLSVHSVPHMKHTHRYLNSLITECYGLVISHCEYMHTSQSYTNTHTHKQR